MRTPAWPLFVLTLGCAHASPARAPEATPSACAAASVAVLREASAAVDPVETWRAVLASDAFRRRLAPSSPAPARLSAQRHGRSAVLHLVARAPSEAGAQAACSAALDALFAFGQEPLEFLQEQQRALQKEVAQGRAALRALEEAHDLVALPAADRLAEARARVRELSRLPASAALEVARGEALRLAALEARWRDQAGAAQEAERRLALVEARLGEATLARIVDQGLRVLDPCAPCRPGLLTPP